MNKQQVNKLIKNGAKAQTDKKNPQQRQVVAAAGKLRIQVGKGDTGRGKTSN
jgi:phosphate starvation-inducible protein PhoH